MTPRALVLDFGGVVIKTPFELLHRLEIRCGIAAGTLAWFGPFDPQRDGLWSSMQRDEITERDYWEHRAAEAGRALNVPTAWSTRDLMSELYKGDADDVVRAEACQAIALARERGITIAVLTNDLAAFHGRDWYRSLSISQSIDTLVDASLTGILKPDSRAYAAMLNELRVTQEEALFVDDQERNVIGAERSGIPSLLFDVTDAARSFERVLRRLSIESDELALPTISKTPSI